MMKSGNPALNDSAFLGQAGAITGGERMTLQGTVNKTAILLVCVLVPAFWVWNKFFESAMMGGVPDSSLVSPYMWLGTIAGLVFALVTIFKKTWSPVTAPLYALAEGLALGGISAFFEYQFPGIVIQAVMLTFGVLFSLLFAYKSGMIRATENFKLGVAAATGGIFLVYLVSMIMGMFGTSIPMIHESGMVGIGFSLVVVVVASLNLVMDFDFIERGAESGAPKYMEWFGAFGLMVTLVWLYLEMLRLLSKLNSRD